MARHRKEYEGEAIDAPFLIRFTRTDRDAITKAAAEQGLTDAEFGRALVLNGLRAYRAGGSVREAHRQAVVKAIAELTEAGDRLNILAKLANREKRIENQNAVVGVTAQLVDLLKAVPPRVTSQPKDTQTKKLVAELAAIGNNVQQLLRHARARLNMRSAIALRGLDAAIVSTLAKVVPE